MIGLDTNILVRYFSQDDPVQSARATEIVEHRLSEANLGFISVVVMVETVWVLDRAYEFGEPDIAAAVERLLQSDVLCIEHEQEVFIAMVNLRNGSGSFSDGLIAALAAKAGCASILTFDRKAPRIPGFQLA